MLFSVFAGFNDVALNADGMVASTDGTGTQGRTTLGSLQLLDGQGKADEEKRPDKQGQSLTNNLPLLYVSLLTDVFKGCVTPADTRHPQSPDSIPGRPL